MYKKFTEQENINNENSVPTLLDCIAQFLDWVVTVWKEVINYDKNSD